MELDRLFVITGVSGGGKTTVTAQIAALHPEISVGLRMTQREPRPGEVSGIDYDFVTPGQMQALFMGGELLYHQSWYGSAYAMRREPVLNVLNQGHPVLIETVVPAAIKLFKENAKVVFLDTPNIDEQCERLKRRGMSQAEIEKRLNDARLERELIADAGIHTIINERLQKTVSEVDRFLFGLTPSP